MVRKIILRKDKSRLNNDAIFPSSHRRDSSFQQRLASTNAIRGQQRRENHRCSLRYLVSFLFGYSLM